jgi:hypothetical protein
VAGDGLIAAYLHELRYSVARLPDVDDIVAEAEDHLLEAIERIPDGRPQVEIEAEAVARFGSAQLVARICIAESKRGAVVPTTRTRYAGLALLAAPILVLVGEIGNKTTGKGGLHGPMVFLLTLSVPALILAFVSPVLSLAAGWGAIAAFAALMAFAICVLAVEMIRAQILPVVPLVLLAIGTVGVLVVSVLAFLVEAVGDIWFELVVAAGMPLVVAVVAVVAVVWLGWHLWREPAVDRVAMGPLATA